AKYAVYLDRQAEDVAAYRRDESLVLPDDLDFAQIAGLSNEMRQKFTTARPRTIGQAGRLDGVTPAALTLLAAHVRRGTGRKVARPWRRTITTRAMARPRISAPLSASDLADDRTRALALTPVSRETLDRLDRFAACFLDTQRHTNLVGPATVPELWTRHIADSLQLLDLAPDARVWLDLGSGGGFPGLVLACALADREGGREGRMV